MLFTKIYRYSINHIRRKIGYIFNRIYMINNKLIEYNKLKYINNKNLNMKKVKKKIPVAIRNAVWNTYIGEEYGRGKCYICEGTITHGTYACGHIIAEALGGETTLENLRPVCTSCNSSQGTSNMIEFKKEYGLKPLDDKINIINIINKVKVTCHRAGEGEGKSRGAACRAHRILSCGAGAPRLSVILH